MHESLELVDARGEPCPRPVTLAMKAAASGRAFAVLVDGEAARDNVLRYAAYAGRVAEAAAAGEGSFRIAFAAREDGGRPSGDPDGAAALPAAAPVAEAKRADEAAIFLLASDRIGQGDDGLGELLMRGFLHALAERDAPPARIILMNGGVRLAAKGSGALESLSALEAAGAEILACGTCLEFFGLKGALGVGRVSNMYEIAGFLSEGRVVRP